MESTTLLIVCTLLAAAPAEASDAATDAGPKAAAEKASPLKSASPAPPLAPVETPRARAGEAEALVRSLADPAKIALAGAPTRLADLISRLVDRRQQIEATQSYWKLSAAVGEYRVCGECVERLQQLLPEGAESQTAAGGEPLAGEEIIAARLAAAEARQREAEVEVLTEQYRLAELARWTNPQALPLPVDLPHVGPYDTKFKQIYSGRVPPPRAYLIDRALPLRLRSLEMRAAAVTAATHAVEGDFDAYARQQLDQLALLDSIAELARQQRAFLAAVEEYNRDIAEFALSVAPLNVPVARMVEMLIPPPPGAAAPSEGSEGLRQAGFDEPLQLDRYGRPSRGAPAAGPPRNEPTLAPPESAEGESEPDKSKASAESDNPAPPEKENSQGKSQEPDQQEPGAGEVKPDEDASGEPKPPVNPFTSSAPDEPKDGKTNGKIKSKRYEAQKPADGADAAAEAPLGLYPALVDLAPQKRAQELAAALHWIHQLPQAPGDAASLDDCLGWPAAAANPGAVVGAYWRARHQAARYQALAQQLEQLQALDPAALAFRSRPDGAEAMLRLKAAERAAAADLVEAELDFRRAQFALALAGGRRLDGPWPLPTTAPHAGRIRLKLAAQPPEIAGLPKMQRLAATIPERHAALEQESAAVVQADVARAAATHRFEQGASPLEEPLAEIRGQTAETLAFLKAQNEYNLEIADYVLTVLPPGTDRRVLAGALVVARRDK